MQGFGIFFFSGTVDIFESTKTEIRDIIVLEMMVKWNKFMDKNLKLAVVRDG